MSLRPLVLTVGLTLGDYVLWKWSLGGHHDAISEVAGLTLPLLGAACAWLLIVNGMRMLTHHTSAPVRRARRRPRRAARVAARGAAGARGTAGAGSTGSGATGSSRDKLAA